MIFDYRRSGDLAVDRSEIRAAEKAESLFFENASAFIENEARMRGRPPKKASNKNKRGALRS